LEKSLIVLEIIAPANVNVPKISVWQQQKAFRYHGDYTGNSNISATSDSDEKPR
jgi:hypothetical protein